MNIDRKEKLPLKKVFLWIFISILLVSGSFVTLFFSYHYLKKTRSQNEHYAINAILQTGPEKELLSTNYLAELMHLSVDKKVNLFDFNEERAKKALLSSPVIKYASVKKKFPDTVYVDYAVRVPICKLYDYDNVGMDSEAYIFPLQPFFTPKKLPEVYLGLLPFGMQEDEFGRLGGTWNTPFETREAKLSLDLVQELTLPKYQNLFRLLRVDVSNAYSELYGQRQIVIVLEDVVHKQKEKKLITYLFPRILRINTENYQEDIEKYLKVRDFLVEDTEKIVAGDTLVKAPSTIIDLRISELAYIGTP